MTDYPPDPNSPLAPEDHHAAQCRAEWTARLRRQRFAGRFLLLWVAAVTLFVAFFLSGHFKLPGRLDERIGLAIVPAYFLPVLFYAMFSMINFRCPRCNKNQNRLHHPRFCFNCGLRLRE